MRFDHSFGDFLNEVGRYPLLTVDQEVLLARQVQRMIQLQKQEAGGHQLSGKERREVRVGMRAKDQMINCNLRMVVSLAKKYIKRVRHLTMLDLVQEGVIGMMRGVEKFDPERGYKGSTYFYWWVRQGISRAITRDDRVIRLPINAIEALNKLRGFIPAFVQEHGRQPSYAECAEHCGIADEQTMREYIKHSAPATSLDQRVNSNDDSSMLIDLIAAEAEDPLADDFWAVRHYLKPVMASLPPEQEEVVQLRFFSQPDTVMSYKVMSGQLGLSPQAIQQREQRALRAMRTRMAIA